METAARVLCEIGAGWGILPGLPRVDCRLEALRSRGWEEEGDSLAGDGTVIGNGHGASMTEVELIESMVSLVKAGHGLREAMGIALGRHPACEMSADWLEEALSRGCACSSASPLSDSSGVADARGLARRLRAILLLCEERGCPPVPCLEEVERSERARARAEALRRRATAVPAATIRLFLLLPVVMLIGEVAMGTNPFGFLLTEPGLLCGVLGIALAVAGCIWVSALLRRFASACTGIAGTRADACPAEGRSAARFGGPKAESLSSFPSSWSLVPSISVRLGEIERTGEREGTPSAEGPDGFLFTLGLLKVCLVSGMPIPGALRTVGQRLGNAMLVRISRCLECGQGWGQSWLQIRGTASESWLAPLERALRDCWERGVSAIGRISRLMDRTADGLEESIDEAASSLQVRLLVPMGLCFLPSFTLLAVVPAIVAYAGG